MSLMQIGIPATCSCGRRILVEQTLFGASHTASTKVCCWDCLTPEQQAAASKKYQLDEELCVPR